MAQKKKSLNKPSTKRASYRKGVEKGLKGAPSEHQDPARRLGNFTTKGEHARQGGRKQGIIGQKRGKFSTDKRGGKKAP